MKTKRLYSLFQRGFPDQDPKRWHRISLLALPKAQAVVHYQSALIAAAFTGGIPERSLRVVEKEELDNNSLRAAISRRLDETINRKVLAYRKFTPGEEICS